MRRDVTYRGDERRLLSVSHDGKNLINFIARSTTSVTQIRRMDESKIRSGSPIRSKYPSKAERKKKKKRKSLRF